MGIKDFLITFTSSIIIQIFEKTNKFISDQDILDIKFKKDIDALMIKSNSNSQIIILLDGKIIAGGHGNFIVKTDKKSSF